MSKLFIKTLALVQLLAIDLTLHDNTTTADEMTVQMKTYYSDYLIDTAKPELVHDQFGQKHPIPKNGGKTIEFRVKKPFAKALTPLVEGVAPAGQQLEWDKQEATVKQYGDYVKLTDMLLLTTIDNNLVYATENCGDQAGRTLDTITREVINGGTSVQYGQDAVDARYLLVGGSATAANNHYLTVDCIERAVRFLKNMHAKKIGGDYVAIVHPDIMYDIRKDSRWEAVKTYDPQDWYNGETGRIAGVRFVETTEAKIFHAQNLTAAKRNLTVKTTLGAPAATVAVDEAITAAEATALVGRSVILNGILMTVLSAASGTAGSATVTFTSNATVAQGTDGVVLYPGEAGAQGRDVYSTLVLGADAYGITEIEGGGLQHFVKQLGSAGTADPLNQISTTGWKATKVAERLVEAYMRRIETTSTFESGAN